MYDAVFLTDHDDVTDVSIITLGPYKCAHVLRKLGYKCLVVTNTVNFTEEDFKELFFYAIGHNTKLVGFSTTFQWVSEDGLASGEKSREELILIEIKKYNKDTKIVLGGSKSHRECANKNVDFAVVGLGETSIVHIMNHLDHGQPLKDSFVNIHGVTIVDSQNKETYDFMSDVMHWLPEDVVNYRTLPIEMARGCIFKCKFCFHRNLGKKKLEYVKKFDALKQELHQAYKDFNITHYQIVDDTFNDDVDKLEQIRKVTDTLPEQLRLWCYMRLDLLGRNPQSIPILKDMGVRATIFGIETMHPKAASVIGKGGSRQRVIDTLQMLRTDFSDLSMHSGFIAGLPYEPVSSLERTLEDLISGKIPLHSWNWMAFVIQKSGIYQADSTFNLEYEKYGYRNRGYVWADKKTINQVANNALVNWERDDWNFEDAWKWTTQKEFESVNCGTYHYDGLLAVGTHTFPAPKLDFDLMRKTLYQDVDFSLIRRAKMQFIQDYKKKLFKLIKT